MRRKDVGNCPCNPGINCEELKPPCYRCGWNPEVAKQRLQKIKAEVNPHEKQSM